MEGDKSFFPLQTHAWQIYLRENSIFWAMNSKRFAWTARFRAKWLFSNKKKESKPAVAVISTKLVSISVD
jgi:hypothetical protein